MPPHRPFIQCAECTMLLLPLLPPFAIYLLCQVLFDTKLYIVPYPFKIVPIQNRVGGGYNKSMRAWVLFNCAYYVLGGNFGILSGIFIWEWKNLALLPPAAAVAIVAAAAACCSCCSMRRSVTDFSLSLSLLLSPSPSLSLFSLSLPPFFRLFVIQSRPLMRTVCIYSDAQQSRTLSPRLSAGLEIL